MPNEKNSDKASEKKKRQEMPLHNEQTSKC